MIDLFWKKRRKKNNQPLPMHPENILIITSDAKLLERLTKVLYRNNYTDNSDIIRLDNGDFALVVKERS